VQRLYLCPEFFYISAEPEVCALEFCTFAQTEACTTRLLIDEGGTGCSLTAFLNNLLSIGRLLDDLKTARYLRRWPHARSNAAVFRVRQFDGLGNRGFRDSMSAHDVMNVNLLKAAGMLWRRWPLTSFR